MPSILHACTYANICMMPAVLYLLHYIDFSHLLALLLHALAIQPAMCASSNRSAGYHLSSLFYRLNGPARPERAHLCMLPSVGLMSSFLADECVRSRPNEFEPHHFQLSKFRDCAALKISPMPSAWVAVIGTTGYVFKPDSDGIWFYVLAVAAQHKLAHLSEDNYLEPTITFVPLDQDEMAGVTKFAYNVADLPPQTRAYIEEEPKNLGPQYAPKGASLP